MGQYYVGLDVHSRQSTFVIEDEEGRVIAQGEVPTTPAGFEHLRATYHLPPGTPVALETGTVAFFAARQLTITGLTPVVVDAHEVRLKAYRPLQRRVTGAMRSSSARGCGAGATARSFTSRPRRYCACVRRWRGGGISCASRARRSAR